jgi:hypothetical protein
VASSSDMYSVCINRHFIFGTDVAFAERLLGSPASTDNYRGYDVRLIGVSTYFNCQPNFPVNILLSVCLSAFTEKNARNTFHSDLF